MLGLWHIFFAHVGHGAFGHTAGIAECFLNLEWVVDHDLWYFAAAEVVLIFLWLTFAVYNDLIFIFLQILLHLSRFRRYFSVCFIVWRLIKSELVDNFWRFHGLLSVKEAVPFRFLFDDEKPVKIFGLIKFGNRRAFVCILFDEDKFAVHLLGLSRLIAKHCERGIETQRILAIIILSKLQKRFLRAEFSLFLILLQELRLTQGSFFFQRWVLRFESAEKSNGAGAASLHRRLLLRFQVHIDQTGGLGQSSFDLLSAGVPFLQWTELVV